MSDLFGARKNFKHSPHIRSQMQLDNQLILIFALINIVMWIRELGFHAKWKNAQNNLHTSSLGFIEEDNLI